MATADTDGHVALQRGPRYELPVPLGLEGAASLEYLEDYPDKQEQHYLDLFFIMQGKPYN